MAQPFLSSQQCKSDNSYTIQGGASKFDDITTPPNIIRRKSLNHCYPIPKNRKEAHKLFLRYVRTRMFYQQRIRLEDGTKPVFISSKEISLRFFRYPRFKYKYEIQWLISVGELEQTKCDENGFEAFYYRALQPGDRDYSLLIPNNTPLDELANEMKQYLLKVTLTPSAPSTPYFDEFLKFRGDYLDLFFIPDMFSGRIHTPISNFHRTHRPNILIDGQETASLDVVTMQPLLLGCILKREVGDNDFSRWINSGEDIYLILQEKAKLGTRDEAKKLFFKILFSRPNQQLSNWFGKANWIEWINKFKSAPFESNPHSIEKNHSNLAWLLQTTEVKLMRKVWQNLVNSKIPFLSVHDEIIVRRQDIRKARKIFENVLKDNFEYYRLSAKSETDFEVEVIVAEPETALYTPPPITNWTEQIIELETYFTTRNLPETPFILSRPETIQNLPFFITAHLTFIKANNGNPTFLPYMYRLQQVKQQLIQNTDGTP